MSEFDSKNAETESLRIQEVLAEIEGNEDQAEIARLKRINIGLVEALETVVVELECAIAIDSGAGIDEQSLLATVNEALRKASE